MKRKREPEDDNDKKEARNFDVDLTDFIHTTSTKKTVHQMGGEATDGTLFLVGPDASVRTDTLFFRSLTAQNIASAMHVLLLGRDLGRESGPYQSSSNLLVTICASQRTLFSQRTGRLLLSDRGGMQPAVHLKTSRFCSVCNEFGLSTPENNNNTSLLFHVDDLPHASILVDIRLDIPTTWVISTSRFSLSLHGSGFSRAALRPFSLIAAVTPVESITTMVFQQRKLESTMVKPFLVAAGLIDEPLLLVLEFLNLVF